MYVPQHFEETRVAVLHALIQRHPFAALVTRTAGGLEANHLPLEVDPEPAPFGTLLGHVARSNPVWRELASGGEGLAVFQGPHGYVSPGWYPSKAESGRVVPTWNYAVVHAHGPLRAIEDPDWLRALVERLTRRHEAGRAQPWQVADAPPDYVAAMLRGIVGIEMRIERLVGKWKLSQNRARPDREGVIAALTEAASPGAAELAEQMRDTLEG
mgnify:CR=1 FL=1